MTRRAIATAAVAAIALSWVIAGPVRATVTRGSPGAQLTISLAGPTGTTTTSVTIAADGTYKADFGISTFGDYTITITRADGSKITAPLKVTQDPEGCVVPPAGAANDAGVTHSPFPADPRFPSYVTVCGRVAFTTPTSADRSTPAGTPPSIGGGESVSREKPEAAHHDDGGDGFPWIWVVVAIVVAGLVVVVVVLLRNRDDDAVGSMYPYYEDTPPPDDEPPPPTPTPEVM
jgi:hypothetical protein